VNSIKVLRFGVGNFCLHPPYSGGLLDKIFDLKSLTGGRSRGVLRFMLEEKRLVTLKVNPYF
jgi:hypothetical protein